MHNPIQIR